MYSWDSLNVMVRFSIKILSFCSTIKCVVCTHIVVRITAVVYEALKPILNEMSQRIEQFDMRLSSLNESMRDDLNSTANMICDNNIEEHDKQTTTELMKINESLTEQIINNSGGLKFGGTWGWRRAVYLDMTDPNTNCPSGWNMTGCSKRTCGRANSSRLSCDSVFFLVSGSLGSILLWSVHSPFPGILSQF